MQKILSFLLEEIYEEEKEPEIPEKYKKVVLQISDSIDAGLVCFLNPDTLEIEDIFKDFIDDPEEFELSTVETIESIGLKHSNWDKCITFEPPESHESFKFMEKFADYIEDKGMTTKLFKALDRKRPFANFKAIIDNSSYRQDWFGFKKHLLEHHVNDILLMELGE